MQPYFRPANSATTRTPGARAQVLAALGCACNRSGGILRGLGTIAAPSVSELKTRVGAAEMSVTAARASLGDALYQLLLTQVGQVRTMIVRSTQLTGDDAASVRLNADALLDSITVAISNAHLRSSPTSGEVRHAAVDPARQLPGAVEAAGEVDLANGTILGLPSWAVWTGAAVLVGGAALWFMGKRKR